MQTPLPLFYKWLFCVWSFTNKHTRTHTRCGIRVCAHPGEISRVFFVSQPVRNVHVLARHDTTPLPLFLSGRRNMHAQPPATSSLWSKYHLYKGFSHDQVSTPFPFKGWFVCLYAYPAFDLACLLVSQRVRYAVHVLERLGVHWRFRAGALAWARHTFTRENE